MQAYYGMEILARHLARLGPLAAGLEEAVSHVLLRGTPASKQYFSFLRNEYGRSCLAQLTRAFEQIYKSQGREPEVDALVRRCFTARGGPSVAARQPLPVHCLSPPPRAAGSVTEMPVIEMRFSHNDQSERFRSAQNPLEPHPGSILQLVTEYLLGLKAPEDVRIFEVCYHEGLWWCLNGNRRLAALRLALRWGGQPWRSVRVIARDVTKDFMVGVGGRRPKLTTHLNGEDCMGSWLWIKETGEAVGLEDALPEYGADLLQLLAMR